MTVAHAATNRRQWLSLAAACFVVGLSIACGSGSPSAQVTPTPDLPQEEALATEEAAGGGETPSPISGEGWGEGAVPSFSRKWESSTNRSTTLS